MINKFERIFELYNKDLFRLIFSYTLNINDTKDILQETFIKYYQNMSCISGSDLEIKKWLVRVAINKSKDYKRFFIKKNIVDFDDRYLINKNISLNYDMIEILNKIDKKYRIPIYLYYYEGYTIFEISKILSISESAVKMRLLRAKKIIKKEMEVI